MSPNPDQIPYVRMLRNVGPPDNIRDIPIVGDLYGTANTIIDFAESGCNPDWHVYVETLFPALGEAVLVLLSFGLDDVLRGYFRPAGGRGFGGLGRASRRLRRPTRAQRARGLLRGGIPEIGELIGKNLPGATVVRGRNIGNAQRWLWRVDGLAQRGLWWWTVADVTEDFVSNWTSAILESEECDCPEHSGFERTGNGFIPVPAPSWAGYNVQFIVNEWGTHDSSAGFVIVPPGMTAAITAECRTRPQSSQPGYCNLRITNAVTGAVLGTSDNEKTAAELGDDLISATAHVSSGVYRWEASRVGSFTWVEEPRVYCWISGCD